MRRGVIVVCVFVILKVLIIASGYCEIRFTVNAGYFNLERFYFQSAGSSVQDMTESSRDQWEVGKVQGVTIKVKPSL